MNSVIDTCSVLNLLSSQTLFSMTRQTKCNFIITNYIEYELLYKTRNANDPQVIKKMDEMDSRIKSKLELNEIGVHNIDLSDLTDPLIASHKKTKSRGELTAIILAKKYSIGVVSDDKKAQNLVIENLGEEKADSVTSLISWLFYHRHLIDSDKETIIEQQDYFNRNQRNNVEEAYVKAMQTRLMESLES